MSGPASLQQLIDRLRVPDQRAALVGLAQATIPGQLGPHDDVVAVVWATADMRGTIGAVAAPFASRERDRILEGVTSSLRLGAVTVLVEQPELEARLAAFVSRHGQGLAAFYVDRPRFVPQPDPAGRPARPMRTPLGRKGWLLPHEWPWGPFVIALEARL